MTGHDPAYWQGRRVLVTGHTGFKGSWLVTYLVDLGAEVLGVSLPGAHTTPSLWDDLGLSEVSDHRADLVDNGWQSHVLDFSPEVVLHLAAQSLVSRGFEDPAQTFRSNAQGTVAVMSLLSALPDLRVALVVTTDKVYDPRQTPPYDESSFLGGRDPYSASKAAAELVVAAWPPGRARWATARAGNVIGGGDWSENRILPDLVRNWTAGHDLVLRRPSAVRPWQHVIEPLIGYLAYCEALDSGQSLPSALNFGPSREDAVTVGDLVSHAAETWTELTGVSPAGWRAEPHPPWLETGTLTLDASASERHLGPLNHWDWRSAVTRTLTWYVRAARGEHPRDLIIEQFAEAERTRRT